MSNMLRGMKKQKQKQGEKHRVKTAQEAYDEGFSKGRYIGILEGNKRASDLFCDCLETLIELEGIGPKRYQAILQHFGYKDRSELTKENRWKE